MNRWWDGGHWTENVAATPSPGASRPIPPFGWPLMFGAALLILGSFMPWVKVTAPFVGTITKSGTEGGDGWFTFGFGVIAGLLAVRALRRRQPSRPMALAMIVLAVLAGGLTIYEFSDLSTKFAHVHTQTNFIATSYGVGLYCLVAGALALGIGGWLCQRNSKRTRQGESPPAQESAAATTS